MKNTPLHILLADDDEGDRLLFTDAFSELKIETVVRTVDNGIQLMDVLSMEDVRLPDFIFLDLNMPRKGGFACLKEIRGNARLKDISVVIYSTSDTEKDREEAFLNGANLYIAKPSNFMHLKQILQESIMPI